MLATGGRWSLANLCATESLGRGHLHVLTSQSTASLPPDLRKVLGRAIQAAREVAEEGAGEALDALGVGAASAHAHMSADERTLRKRLRSKGRQAGDRRKRDGTQQIEHLVQEVAYAHWHRMLFARFLAENRLLIAPGHGVAVSLEDCRALAREESRSPWELAGEWAGEVLPEVFPSGDPVLALSLSPETVQALEELLESLSVEVFTARDSLGWTYQYWRTKEKDRINKSDVKIGAYELPAVTQFFTERYMVLFLLHNTIGAWRAGKMLAAKPELASSASDEAVLRRRARLAPAGGYDFEYLRFVRAESEKNDAVAVEGAMQKTGPWRPAAGSFSDWPETAKKIRALDPCCGSGHFLVELLELLVRLRMEEERLSVKEAVQAVLRDNIFGLEIDPRCAQIAAFNVALSAWRLAGEWIALPHLNVACSGIEPVGSETDWARLGRKLGSISGTAATGERFQEGMCCLYRLFQQARTLGSLIDPTAEEGDLLGAGFEELDEVLDAALEAERRTGNRNERMVVAAGMSRAIKFVRQRYTLVTTNVPFLARGRQCAVLRDFAEKHYGDAKTDLATIFLSRIFRLLSRHGAQALVTPQEWLFLKSYQKLRGRLLKERTWSGFARLGEGAFENAAGRSSALILLSAGRPNRTSLVAGLDVSAPLFGGPPIRAAEKARLLQGQTDIVVSNQSDQVRNPDTIVTMRPLGHRKLLAALVHGHQGLKTVDNFAFKRSFWEVRSDCRAWISVQDSVTDTVDFGGREHVIFRLAPGRHNRRNESHILSAQRYVYIGRGVWGSEGIAVSQMRALPATRYTGEKFVDTNAVLGPLGPDLLPAVWAFCSSPEYAVAVREINQKLSVTNATLVKVPFDRERWTKIAEKRYPNGLPEPYSDDPTQWIFHGDPCRSVVWDEETKRTAHGLLRFDKTVLQVAVARLLGYRWPAEDDPAMRLAPEQRAFVERVSRYDDLADADGIVCLSSARGERSAEDRLRELLARAYEGEWSAAVERRLIAASLSPLSPPPPPPPACTNGYVIITLANTASSSITAPSSGTCGTVAGTAFTRSSTTTSSRVRAAKAGAPWSP